MKKLDATVRQETKYIAVWVLLFSAVMEAVFLIIGKWDYTVLPVSYTHLTVSCSF